jgi:hypothetical protein
VWKLRESLQRRGADGAGQAAAVVGLRVGWRGDCEGVEVSYAALGAISPVAMLLPDGSNADNMGAFGYAVALGVLPNTAAGRAIFDQWNGTYGAALYPLASVQAITANPQLAALFTSYRGAQDVNVDGFESYNSPADGILESITHAPNTTIYGTGLELPAGLDPSVQAQYLAAIQQMFPAIVNDMAYQRSPGVLDAQQLSSSLSAARAAAVAAGTRQAGPYTVATSLILEGPVALPDGMNYVVMGDVPGGDQGGVLWWQGPNFVPAYGITHYGDECGWKPGTGEWYMLGSIGAICPAPPLGWVSDDFSLVSPRARASINGDDSQYHLPTVTTPGALPIPALPPVSVAPMANPVLLAPTVIPVPSSTSAPIVLDDGTVVNTMGPTQAPGGGLVMATPFLFNKTELLLAAGALLVGLVVLNGRRK